MRQDLRPAILEAVAGNLRHFDAVQCYEIGKRYGRGFGVDATP